MILFVLSRSQKEERILSVILIFYLIYIFYLLFFDDLRSSLKFETNDSR